MSSYILVVDDEADICAGLSGILEDEGYRVRTAFDPDEAFAALKAELPDLVLLDIWFQNRTTDGLAALAQISKNYPSLPVVMMSGHGTIETAVQAIKQGAYDFVEKPFKTDRLLQVMGRALETKRLKDENMSLRASMTAAGDFTTGAASIMSALRHSLDKAAGSNSRVLITGEAGVGKEVAARYLHSQSPRADKPFVVVSCATMHPDHFEAELFGVEGTSNQPGLLERAQGGTLFLDEVADMPPETQGKILRVLQEQVFHRLGGSKPISVDIRILSATGKDLPARIRDGRFREELYYRLNVVSVSVPPLRERRGDVALLVDQFIKGYALASGRPPRVLAQSTLSVLESYLWPGNVRQLKNVIEGLMIMADGDAADEIKPAQLPPEFSSEPRAGSESAVGIALLAMPLKEARDQFERDYLEYQMERFGGSVSRTAQFIGMERSALHRKLKSLNVVTRDDAADEDQGDEDAAIRLVSAV